MKAILVDDEPLALDFLESQIKKISTLHVVDKFTNLDINKRATLLQDIDIVFLDIEMPETNGLELAEKLLEVNSNLTIVFVTAFNDYAVQAFELNVLDYLLKPVQLDRLKKTLDRIKNREDDKKNRVLDSDNNLQINVCRELTFESSKGKSEIVQWRTTKAQELFLYLLHHHGKTMRKSELVELLWPDFDQRRAYSQLYTAIYHIRKTLRIFSDHFIIKNMQEGYILKINNVFVDMVRWEKKLKAAPTINVDTITEYETIMDLYTGPYLQEYDYLWAESERYRLENLWLKTANQIASYYHDQRELEKAETWYVEICKLRPENEDAHFSLMDLYDILGLGLLVDHQYIQLKKALEELNLQVSPNITKWYKQWKGS